MGNYCRVMKWNLLMYVAIFLMSFFLVRAFSILLMKKGETGLSQSPFSQKKHAMVIEPNSGIIRGISDDVSRLYPAGFNVVEVDTLPEECDCNGGWIFDGEKVVKRIYLPDELKEQARRKQRRLLDEATKVITPLQDAADLDMATDAEKSALLAWKKYRVLLNRVDISNAEWPALPE